MKQGCEIEAIGINHRIRTKKNQSRWIKSFGTTHKSQNHPEPGFRHVLKDVSFKAKPWEILAIVGPSGAGKSTLLEILSGKLVTPDQTILVDNRPIDRARFKKISGYVTQKADSVLFPLLTVKETLAFTAKLRLSLPRSELAARVDSLIQELGLRHVAGTRVGDDECKVRGVSGGERRRVAIGVDVIHDPRVVILDEPTSGLDSSSALQIIDMLKSMAETRGRTVILSIHQPGFRIVKLINTVLLLANGSVLHHGSVDQLSVRLMSIDNIQVPLHVNVVEFAIDSIESIVQQKQHHENNLLIEGKKQVRNGKITLQQLFRQSKVMDFDEISIENVSTDDDSPMGYANSRLGEILILTYRFTKNIYRTKELFTCRTIQMIVAGIVLGSIFYDLKDDLSGAEERVGLFAFILTFLLTSTIEALPIFLQEREILMKEISCGSYRLSSYAIANAFVYLPFLLILSLLFSIPLYWLVGLNHSFEAFSFFLLLIWLILYTANSVVVCFSALVPNFIVGNSVISGVMGSFFLFSGYFISKKGMPGYWVFMHYVSLFKYPFEAFLINEFSGSNKCLEYVFGRCEVSGEDVMREAGYGEESRWRNVVIMVCFIMVYRFISYIILRCRCSPMGLKGSLV